MQKLLHIIEPTLETEAGHCYSFISSLIGSGTGKGWSIRLWTGRRARFFFNVKEGVWIERFFFRRVRRLQELFLYRRLLQNPGRLFISTATRTDLALLNAASKKSIPANKVYLYFHWFRPDNKKLKYLRHVSQRHPNIVVLGPTDSVVETFQQCGFRNVLKVPYPITPVHTATQHDLTGFRHLLYAGAAREDKGFPHIVNLVDYMNTKQMDIPISIQASPDHYDKYGPSIKADITRLLEIHYPFLKLNPKALMGSEYQEQFRGAICLQPYSPEDFADRISGITLDALSSGCPIVTIKNTWMSRVVERFEAGISVDEAIPENMWNVIEDIMKNYQYYQSMAYHAGKVLQEELSATHLFGVLTA